MNKEDIINQTKKLMELKKTTPRHRPWTEIPSWENTIAAKELPTVLTFGENNEWAVHHDDGCLIFHPQWNTSPHKTSIWIWKEAWEFVQNQGGFDNLVARLRDIKSRLELKNLLDTSS